MYNKISKKIKKGEYLNVENNKEKRISEISVLVENLLLKQIRCIYEDVNTTSKEKKEEREKITKQFVDQYLDDTLLTKEEVIEMIDNVIAKAKWIKEIEELDEEFEDER